MRRFAVTMVLALLPVAAAAPAAGAASKRTDRVERSVIREINRARGAHGLPALRASRPLARAAHHHSRDMLRRDFFAHASSDGTAFSRRVGRYLRARRVGETLAWSSPGRGLARRVVRMWLRSPGHRAILLERGFSRVGVGRARGRLGVTPASIVTADFASRR